MADSPGKEITFSSDAKLVTAETTREVSNTGAFNPPSNPTDDRDFGKILGLTITPDLFPVIGNTFGVDASIVGDLSQMRVEFNYNSRRWTSTNLPFDLTAAGEVDEVQTVSLRTVGGSEVILDERSENITLAGSDTDFVRILSASITGGVYGTSAGTTLSYELNKTEGVTVNTKWYISPPASWKL